MSDGHGSPPEQPPGWSAQQPPPYGGPGASPWAVPGGGQEPQAPPASSGGPQFHQPHPQAPQAPQFQPPHPQFQPPPHQYGPPHGHASHGFRPPPPALRPGIIPLRPLSLSDILDGTIKLIRSNPKAVLGLSTIAAALGALPVAIGQALLTGSIGGLADDLASPSSQATPPVGALVGLYGGTLVSLIVQFVAVTVLSGVLTRILGRAVFGGKVTASEAWRLTRGRLPALFGLVIITGLITLAPLVPIVGLIVLLGETDLATIAVVVILSIVFYIAYALFFTTRFAFAAPAIVLERLGVIAAMRRSWRLVTGDFWRVFGILLLTSVLVSMISSLLSLPFTFAGGFMGAFGAGSLPSLILTAVLIAIGGTLGSMIIYPIQAGVNGLLYADRRMRSEAFDLVLQTAAIEQQRQGWVHSSADDLWHPGNSADQNRQDQHRP
jgi:hypothetical protein